MSRAAPTTTNSSLSANELVSPHFRFAVFSVTFNVKANPPRLERSAYSVEVTGSTRTFVRKKLYSIKKCTAKLFVHADNVNKCVRLYCDCGGYAILYRKKRCLTYACEN